MSDLETDERLAIASLKRLAKRWPKSLMLFSGSGSLHVLKMRPDGVSPLTPGGGMDPEAIVETILGIPNDGGDW